MNSTAYQPDDAMPSIKNVDSSIEWLYLIIPVYEWSYYKDSCGLDGPNTIENLVNHVWWSNPAIYNSDNTIEYVNIRFPSFLMLLSSMNVSIHNIVSYCRPSEYIVDVSVSFVIFWLFSSYLVSSHGRISGESYARMQIRICIS